MSLLEELEKDKAALAELENQENETPKEEEQDDGNSEEEQPKAEEGADDESGEQSDSEDEDQENGSPEEEGKGPDKKDDKEEQNNVAEQVRRRKEAAERKRQKQLEEQVRQLEEQNKSQKEPQSQVKADEEPDIQKNPVEWLQWNNNRLEKEIAGLKKSQESQQKNEEQERVFSEAVNAFVTYENDAKSRLADYDDVAEFMAAKMAESVKFLNPSMSPQDIGKEVQRRILMQAANLEAQGYNPAEELYYMAKEQYGYQPKQSEEKQEPRRNLQKVAENRKRNAGMAGAPGKSRGAETTLESAASMSPVEWSKLPASEKRRIMGVDD